MSKIISTEPLTVTTTERTWRVQIHCTEGADYVLEAFREQVRRADAVELGRNQNAGMVSRALSSVVGETYTCADGTVISVANLAEALAGFIEAWRTEDIEPPSESAS